MTLGVPAFGLSLLMMLMAGVWDFAVPIFAGLLATLGVGSGIAVVMSIGALAVAAVVWLVALAQVWMDRTDRPGPVDALLRRLVGGSRTRDQRAVDQPPT